MGCGAQQDAAGGHRGPQLGREDYDEPVECTHEDVLAMNRMEDFHYGCII